MPAWPVDRSRHAVVFVDFMNVLLSFNRDVYFHPSPTVEELMEMIDKLAKTIGQEVHGIVFLDEEHLSESETMAWLALRTVCVRLGYIVVDVSPKGGRDDVDAVLINYMVGLGEYPDPSVRFLLASSDNDFRETVERLAERRGVYVAVPPQPNLPRFCSVSSGFSWIHPWTWEALAYNDALSARRLADPMTVGNVPFLRNRHGSYRRAYDNARRVLASFMRSEYSFSSTEDLCTHLARLGVAGEEERLRLAVSLRHFEVLKQRKGNKLVPDQTHPALSALRAAS